MVFFYNPNKVTPVDILWCFVVSGSQRKRKINTSHSLGTTFITTILHVLNSSELLRSILKGERQNYETGQNPKTTILKDALNAPEIISWMHCLKRIH